MARIEVHADRLVIRLTPTEKALAMHRRDIVVDRSAITSALIANDPWVWLRGTHGLGLHIPGRASFGVWQGGANRDFALIRRGRVAVVIDVNPAGGDGGAGEDRTRRDADLDAFDRLVVSTTHAGELVSALRFDAEDEGGSSPVFTTDTGR